MRKKVKNLRMVNDQKDVPSEEDKQRFIPVVKKFFEENALRRNPQEMYDEMYKDNPQKDEIGRWHIKNAILHDEADFDPRDWYQLLTPYQFGRILAFVLDDPHPVMINSEEFLRDSSCNWAYIINLDTETLEVYMGFQERPQKRNPLGTKKDKYGGYPPKLVRSFPLLRIPKNWEDGIEQNEEDGE